MWLGVMGEQRQKNRVSCASDEIIVEIASLVASETAHSPIELQPPLGEQIDVDALQKLVQTAPAGLQLTFWYQGQKIVVTKGSDVTIRTSRAGD